MTVTCRKELQSACYSKDRPEWVMMAATLSVEIDMGSPKWTGSVAKCCLDATIALASEMAVGSDDPLPVRRLAD